MTFGRPAIREETIEIVFGFQKFFLNLQLNQFY